MPLVPEWNPIDPVADEVQPQDFARAALFNDIYQRLMFLRRGGGAVDSTGLVSLQGTGRLWFPSDITISAFRVNEPDPGGGVGNFYPQRAYLYLTRPDGTRLVLLSVEGRTNNVGTPTSSRSATFSAGVYAANLAPGTYGLYTFKTTRENQTLDNSTENEIMAGQVARTASPPPAEGEISTGSSTPMIEL